MAFLGWRCHPFFIGLVWLLTFIGKRKIKKICMNENFVYNPGTA